MCKGLAINHSLKRPDLLIHAITPAVYCVLAHILVQLCACFDSPRFWSCRRHSFIVNIIISSSIKSIKSSIKSSKSSSSSKSRRRWWRRRARAGWKISMMSPQSTSAAYTRTILACTKGKTAAAAAASSRSWFGRTGVLVSAAAAAAAAATGSRSWACLLLGLVGAALPQTPLPHPLLVRTVRVCWNGFVFVCLCLQST